MKYATRLNSFVSKGVDIETALRQIAATGVVEYVDLNFPEHFQQHTPQQMKQLLDELGLTTNSVAMRFRDHYLHGEYTNRDPQIRQDALTLTKEGIDATVELGCDLVTIWLGFDGFDYTFQKDYAQSIDLVVSAFQELADYRSDVRLSIEYKPYEERVHALISNVGMTLHVLNQVDRQNVGATLDFCHMLMAGDQPAMGASILLAQDKLWGVQLNDGNNAVDDGLMAGSIHPYETAEFLYYLLRYDYQGVIYFDTFPRREEPLAEVLANVESVERLLSKVKGHGVDAITEVVKTQDGVASQHLRNALLGQ
ncbi:sugar phosphate isomerase/epimerase family protein [Streptomyces sp. NPDC051016]|uniref:sugar phosphate isomerase/epimerase family protein n=1 Tax=Streptomyces sp. NPDC051016 TaxID=3365638 RepID=UPI00379411FB